MPHRHHSPWQHSPHTNVVSSRKTPHALPNNHSVPGLPEAISTLQGETRGRGEQGAIQTEAIVEPEDGGRPRRSRRGVLDLWTWGGCRVICYILLCSYMWHLSLFHIMFSWHHTCCYLSFHICFSWCLCHRVICPLSIDNKEYLKYEHECLLFNREHM